MKEKLLNNFKESVSAVLPIAILAIILSFIFSVDKEVIFAFIIGIFLLVIGMTFFTTGANMAMITIGEMIGKSLMKQKKKWVVILVTFLIGFIITIAEPDLTVLAQQITSVPNIIIILFVSLGLGLFLIISVLRIIKNISFQSIVMLAILLIIGLLYFTPKAFIPMAFDSGGVTTGPISVPLIVALGYGITSMIKSSCNEDRFGLCGIASLGPVIIILILSLFYPMSSSYDVAAFNESMSIMERLVSSFSDNLSGVCLSILPIILVIVVYQFLTKKLKKIDIAKMSVGIIFTFIGLIIFLTGVNLGFLQIGYDLGVHISLSNYHHILIPIGMIFGFIIVNAEPALRILNQQISDLTEGSLRADTIKYCLALGISLAVGLSLVRIYYQIPISYFLIPGYIIVCLLTYFSPKVFTSIAFDIAGASSGPLTTSFLLPICIGACEALGGEILVDAFGVVALVAMTPLITIQLLGTIYQTKQRRSLLAKEFNETIVEFNWEV